MLCVHRLISSFMIVLALPGISVFADENSSEITPAQAEFFEKKIRPVFANNCYECHGEEEQEASLRLDKYAFVIKGGDTGPAVVPGDPKKSEIVDAILYDPDGYQMPPSGKLPQADIDNIIAWVKMGAPWPGADKETLDGGPSKEFNIAERLKHWAYQPIQNVEPPQISGSDWVKSPVDAFILKALQEKSLQPAQPADKRTLLRRVTFDLIGLPPTKNELEAFLADDSPQAFEKVVDRLLANPAYGERWGRHWLDLVRFAETAGHEFDYEIPHAWRYRDYVIRAFNADLSYDQFLVEHLAGDLLENPRRQPETGNNESILATGFYWFAQGKHSPVDIRAEECDTVDNQIDVIGRAFLGSSIACSRCHDHKFDPISTRDYYAMAGFLQSSRRDTAIINPPEQSVELARQIQQMQTDLKDELRQTTAKSLIASLDNLPAQLLAASDAWVKNPEAEGWPKYLTQTAAKNENHPLYLWSQLGHVTDTEEFRKRIEHFQRHFSNRLEASKKAPADSVLFEDFSSPEMNDWFTSGPAFQNAVTTTDELTVGTIEQPITNVWKSGTLNSGLAGGEWQGFFRSPTFEITHNTIWYRVKRVGGKPNLGRRHKNGQINLIVDGFQLIQNPLYGMLSINVPNDGNWHWMRQDVGKFPGHNAYIEIGDEDDGTLVVDEILFSNESHSPDAPEKLPLVLAYQESVVDRESLAAAYAENLKIAVRDWANSEADRESLPLNAINWLLQFELWTKTTPIAVKPETPLGRSLQTIEKMRSQIPAPAYALTTTDGTPENEHVLIRGQHTKEGNVVPRRYLEAFNPGENPLSQDSSGRLELARKFVASDNPLTSRVIVNRLWHHHFGKGIVPTVDDFGHMGKAPSHPELLDWLATELMNNGWSLKHMHRVMLLSNAYQMTSDLSDAKTEQTDPENLLLHRMNLQRLEGEAIRDGILQISNRLNTAQYGPSVLPHLTPFMEGRGRPGSSGPLDGGGRRSIYINVRRNFLTPLFLAFDFPTPFTTMGRRSVSNVPAQALTLMNNEFVVQQAKLWSENVLKEFPDDAENATTQRINTLYQTALSRLPTAAEIQIAEEFVSTQSKEYGESTNHPQAWADLCHVMFNLKEFYYVR